jgi:hypothetical protein
MCSFLHPSGPAGCAPSELVTECPPDGGEVPKGTSGRAVNPRTPRHIQRFPSSCLRVRPTELATQAPVIHPCKKTRCARITKRSSTRPSRFSLVLCTEGGVAPPELSGLARSTRKAVPERRFRGSTPCRGHVLVQPRRSRLHAPYRGYSPGEFSEPSVSQVEKVDRLEAAALTCRCFFIGRSKVRGNTAGQWRRNRRESLSDLLGPIRPAGAIRPAERFDPQQGAQMGFPRSNESYSVECLRGLEAPTFNACAIVASPMRPVWPFDL